MMINTLPNLKIIINLKTSCELTDVANNNCKGRISDDQRILYMEYIN